MGSRAPKDIPPFTAPLPDWKVTGALLALGRECATRNVSADAELETASASTTPMRGIRRFMATAGRRPGASAAPGPPRELPPQPPPTPPPARDPERSRAA